VRTDSANQTSVRRYDASALGEFERTPQGGFRIPAFPTKVGVFVYMLPDGTSRREYRPPEEVLAADSLATLAHAPVTDLHPEKEGVRIPVTPENYRELAVGHVGEDVRPESDHIHVACSVLVQDAGMMLKIEARDRCELSSGYSCVLDPTPGVTDQGEIYDAIQRRIRYNHVALGPRDWGRAGSTVALRLDSGDAIQQAQKDAPVKEIIDGKEYTIGTPEWQAAIQAQRAKLTAERDQAMGRADAAEKGLTAAKSAAPDPKIMNEAIVRRVKLVADCKRAANAAKVKFDDDMAAAADEGTLIVEAIKLLDPAFDPKGKTADYMAGYFASLVKGLGAAAPAETEGLDGKKEEQPMPPADPAKGPTPPGTQKTDSKPSIFSARAGGPAQDQRTDAAQGPNPDKARADMQERQRNRWKFPAKPS
jgi:hypothetical protein